MHLDALNLFARVARAGSFAKAAEQHHLDPSLVSRKIASLERELGFRLFQRTTRVISLTEAGAEFLTRIEPHVTAIDEARIAGRDLTEQPQGLLRVTASTSFGYEILTPLLPKLMEHSPNLEIELLLTDRRINMIEEGIDLAVRLGVLPDSDLVATKLMPIKFRIYASSSFAGLSKASDELNCLTYPGGQQSRGVVVQKSGSTSTMILKGSVTISNALALKRCACLGLGPAFLPDWLVKAELAAGTLVDVFPDWEFTTNNGESAAWCVYPSRLYTPLKVRKFVDFLTEELREP